MLYNHFRPSIFGFSHSDSDKKTEAMIISEELKHVFPLSFLQNDIYIFDIKLFIMFSILKEISGMFS